MFPGLNCGHAALRLDEGFGRRARPAAVVNPRQVRNFARARGELAESDSIDARILYAFARV
jgi:transposase